MFPPNGANTSLVALTGSPPTTPFGEPGRLKSELGRMFLNLAADESKHEKSLMREYAVFRGKLAEAKEPEAVGG